MASNALADGLLVHFDNLPDPRSAHGKIHSLQTILTIALVGMICGADTWTEIEEFGKTKSTLFVHVFGVAQRGIPSHDTFSRVFSLLDPPAFRDCFANWARTLVQLAGQIAIDGKTLRGSYDTFNERVADHMVSAYANSSGMVVAQVACDQKSNEITAIPELLRLLDLSGCTVTIDAMGTQVAIAEQIIQGGGHYVLAVKGNQPTLEEEVIENFEKVGVQDDARLISTVDKGHGRLECRRYTLCPVKDYLTEELCDKWAGLQTMIMVDNDTEFVNGKRSGQSRRERRFFISSLPMEQAVQLVTTIRGHWAIENSLHYILDVSFNEDYNRTRQGNAAINQAVVRHFALNLLKREKTVRLGIKAKRKKAGWDDDYLLKVLTT